MSTFLIRSATSQSINYPVVLTKLDELHSRLNPHYNCGSGGIEPETSWLVARHADHSNNEAIYIDFS